MADKPVSEYANRNSGPILEVLRQALADRERVLEIGAGTGQHAVCFASAMPHLVWQASDRAENIAGIRAWIDDAALPNLPQPLVVDVMQDTVPAGAFDAVYSANTAHIMGVDAVDRMFAIVGATLTDDGVFCLYGPFRQNGEFNTPSNAQFDQSLRARDPAMGIRDIELLDKLATREGMSRSRLVAMPANNHLAVWTKDDR